MKIHKNINLIEKINYVNLFGMLWFRNSKEKRWGAYNSKISKFKFTITTN